MRSALSGFSLLELIVVIAIVAVFAATGLPNFSSSADKNQLSAAERTLVSELSFARSEAVKRQEFVAICASSSGESCDAMNWARGRIVFSDDGDGVFDDDEILRSYSKLSGDLTVTSTNFPSNGVVVFSRDGSVDSSGSIVICNAEGNVNPSAVNVNAVGRPQRAYDSDGDEDGLVNDVVGGNVSC